MSRPFLLTFKLSLGALSLALLVPAPGWAQGKSSQTPAAAVGEARKAKDDAKSLAKGGNVQAVEDTLTRSNKSLPNTAEWHVETMQKLTDIARDLAREGGGSAVPGLATQALQHVTQANARTTDSRVKAQVQAAAAVIHEQIVGDPTAALAAYRTAVQLDPSDKGIKEALDRLERADAVLRARIQSKKK